MIKLIASDLDGTLIGRDFRFRPRTLRALEAAVAAGIQVVFVTGRPHRWLAPIREQMAGYDSYAICSNGAVTYHLGADRVEHCEATPVEQVAAAHRVLQGYYPEATYTAETLEKVYIQGPYEPGGALEGAHIIEGPLEDAFEGEGEFVKYLMRVPGGCPETLLDEVRQLVGQWVSVTQGVAGDPLIEMARPGLSKGRVLADFAARYGVQADEVAAFGDMPNDTEMLRWAGSGYAMASGAPRLIEDIGKICPGFEEDGVAQVIEQILADSQR